MKLQEEYRAFISDISASQVKVDERREELRRRLRAKDPTLANDLSFCGLASMLVGFIIGCLIFMTAQAAFADSWVEETPSGVIVHEEGDSFFMADYTGEETVKADKPKEKSVAVEIDEAVGKFFDWLDGK